jgi:hypothetical protein
VQARVFALRVTIAEARFSGLTVVAAKPAFLFAHDKRRYVKHAQSVTPHARKTVGWRVSRLAHAGFVLDAVEQAARLQNPSDNLCLFGCL